MMVQGGVSFAYNQYHIYIYIYIYIQEEYLRLNLDFQLLFTKLWVKLLIK